MKEIKKKYGLAQTAAMAESKIAGDKYQDRAGKRRREVGSDNPNEKTEVADVTKNIKRTNKGFKMLAGMGWKEGEGLGRPDAQGRVEPVQVELRAERAGLGSSASEPGLATDRKSEKKREILKITQERFERA